MSKTVGRELYDAGWRQGSLLPKLTAQVYEGTVSAPRLVTSTDPPADGLVLVTQDCDLVKDESKIPYLEAILFIRDLELATKIRANDVRYFVLDQRGGIVADRSAVVLVRRSLLVGSRPDFPAGFHGDRRRRFARWLGARYDRPALPDEFNGALTKPLSKALRALCAPSSKNAWLNDVLHEVRVVGDLEAPPPWRVELIFLMATGTDIDQSRLLIAELIDQAKVAVDGTDEGDAVVVVENLITVCANQLSVFDYQSGVGLPLDTISLAGDETTGAVPFHAD